jgi:hypothetical protein
MVGLTSSPWVGRRVSAKNVIPGTLICIHSRDSGGVARTTEIRLSPDRDDDATAAYVLRDWMQRL